MACSGKELPAGATGFELMKSYSFAFYCSFPAALPGTCLQELSGELLALAGPLDPSAIAFDPSAAFSPAQPGGSGSDELPGTAGEGTWSSGGGRTQGSQQTPGAATGGRAGGSRISPAGGRGSGGSGSGGTWAAALQLLGDYLVDESVEVIRAAQFTVRRLLATPEGQAALQQTGPALRPYLAAFQHEPSAGEGFARPSGEASDGADDGPTPLGSRQLWRCDRPYAAWVCALADAVLSKVRWAWGRPGLGMTRRAILSNSPTATSLRCACPVCAPLLLAVTA